LFTSRLTNQFRANLTWNTWLFNNSSDNFGGATPLDFKSITDAAGQPTTGVEAFTFLLSFGGTGLLVSSPAKTAQRQLNIVDSINYSLGAHAIKFGVDYRRLITPITLSHLAESGVFTSKTQVQQGIPGTASVIGNTPIPIG